MLPFKEVYNWAGKKVFDLYELLKGLAEYCGMLLSRLHTGVLGFYSLWIALGFVIFLWIMK